MARKRTNTKAGPNAGSRKAAARKAGKCQLCGSSVTPQKAKSVIVDPPGTGKVSIVKSREGKSYWCPDCAKGKAASYERAIARKRSNGTGTKPAAKKGKAAKAQAKPAARKRTVKAGKGKGTRKRAKAASAAEPF